MHLSLFIISQHPPHTAESKIIQNKSHDRQLSWAGISVIIIYMVQTIFVIFAFIKCSNKLLWLSCLMVEICTENLKSSCKNVISSISIIHCPRCLYHELYVCVGCLSASPSTPSLNIGTLCMNHLQITEAVRINETHKTIVRGFMNVLMIIS